MCGEWERERAVQETFRTVRMVLWHANGATGGIGVGDHGAGGDAAHIDRFAIGIFDEPGTRRISRPNRRDIGRRIASRYPGKIAGSS